MIIHIIPTDIAAMEEWGKWALRILNAKQTLGTMSITIAPRDTVIKMKGEYSNYVLLFDFPSRCIFVQRNVKETELGQTIRYQFALFIDEVFKYRR